MPMARLSPSSVKVLSVKPKAQDDEGADDRGRDREDDVQRRGPAAEEQPAHQRGGQRDHGAQRELELVHRFLDELGGIEVHRDAHAFRQRFRDLGHALLDALRHRHGVGTALLADADTDRTLAVGARDAADVVQAVLDGHLTQDDARVDRLAAALVDDDFLELLRSSPHRACARRIPCARW
jgi:hypothetical protein